MKQNNYLVKERVGKLLLQFVIPSTLALVISCLYNIVDQIFVGNGIGYLGNAATGIIFAITVVGWGASVLLRISISFKIQNRNHDAVTSLS